jgi:hypothetical protein
MQVTLEHHTHAFAIQSLHHAYHVFGYEGALRHLQVYHGLQTLRPDGVQSSTSTAVVNTVINEPISYTRTQIPEAGRCTKVLSNGNQCTFHKSGDSEFCARHFKAEVKEVKEEVKEDVKEEVKEDTESKVVVVDDKKEKQRAYQAAYRQKQKM